MSSEDFQVNEYQLTIISVKMKVKFPCKMKLQHSSNAITEEVQSNEQSKFIFNQQITIHQETQKASFELNIILITQKGAKYVSGVMKLSHDELQKSSGQKTICPLIKCLDNEAFCQLIVNRVKSGKLPKRISISSTLLEYKNLKSNNQMKTYTNEEKQILSPRNRQNSGVQTKSQFGFAGTHGKMNHDWEDTRSKGATQTLIYKSSFLRSPKSKKTFGTGMVSPKSKMSPQFNQEYEILSQRQKLSSESQVYKQGYQKLKEKFKKQSEELKSQQNKRMQLEANQNNFKIEIMRLKLKTQEQQRIITLKNQKINQLQVFISEINKQELDMNYLKQENNNLEYKIEMMVDVINGLKRQNQVQKKLSQQRTENQKKIIHELRFQLENSKQKFDNFLIQSSENLRNKTQQILQLSSQLKSKTSLIQLQKSQIHKLEAHVQDKIYDFQKTLQQQKNQSTHTNNQLKQKIEHMEREKKNFEKQIGELKSEKQKIKNLVLKAEYDKKILLEQQKSMKGELLDLKSLKQKYAQSSRELNFLSEDKKNLAKQLQSVNQSKQINIQQINEQFQLKLNYYRKQTKQLEQKHKNLASNKIQLESQIQVATNAIDKQKRQIQTFINQGADLKRSIQQLKQYSNVLQQHNLSLQNQLAFISNQLRFAEQTSRMQTQKYKNELQRTKNQLAAENVKSIHLFQSKSNLENQLNKNKIQLQYHQQKIDKLFASNKEYQNNIEYLTKQHELQLYDTQQTVIRNQTELKQCYENLHQAQLQKILFNQRLQTAKKEQKLAQQKISYLDSQLKARNVEIFNRQQRQKDQQKTLSLLQTDHQNLKHDDSLLKTEKNKLQRILQIKEIQIQSFKKEYIKLNKEKQALSNTQDQLRGEIKKANQKYTKLEIRLKSTDRQYNNFKQLMQKTITTQFAKLPLIRNSTSLQQENQFHLSQAKEGNQSKVTLSMNRQNKQTTEQILTHTLNTALILSSLNSSITQSKMTLFKLIQHNKQLKKQIQILKDQCEKSSNKYQFTQIQLSRGIQQLEEQLQQIYEDKQQEIINSDKIVSQLNAAIHQKQNICCELQQQVQELQYTLSSLKLDFQTNNAKNDKKVNILKSTITQLEEKIEHFEISLSNQEVRNHEIQESLQNIKAEKQDLLQTILRSKVSIEQLKIQIQKLEISLEQSTRDKKTLLQKFNELQIHFNEQKQLKIKNRQILQEEQKKNNQLREFISTLMKQKQKIIKSELQKSDQIIELQTQQIQLKRDIQINAEDLQRIKSELQQNKEKLRKQLSITKNTQYELNESVSKSKKLSQKLQEKEKQIQMKDQIITRLDKKYKQLAEKNYKQTLQLHTQIDSKYHENINLTKQMNLKVILIQAKLQELQHDKAKRHHEHILVSDQLLAQKEHTQLLKRQILKLEAQLEQIGDQYKAVEKRNEQLTQQVQQREQQLSQLNDKIIVLEGQQQALSKDKSFRLEELNNDWLRKYQHLIEQQEQKFKIMENEKQIVRSQLEQNINQLEVSLNQNKNSDLGTQDIKKNYEQKIKKLQNDRFNTILNKNNEIKKLTEQNKLLNQKMRGLEAAQKQNSQLLQNLGKRLIGQQKLRKELDQRVKSQNKVHQGQMTSLLSKQEKNRYQKQQIYLSIWSNQRQVRKVTQNYLKKIFDQCDNVHIHKITNSSKGLEAQLVKAMTYKLQTASQ